MTHYLQGLSYRFSILDTTTQFTSVVFCMKNIIWKNKSNTNIYSNLPVSATDKKIIL